MSLTGVCTILLWDVVMFTIFASGFQCFSGDFSLFPLLRGEVWGYIDVSPFIGRSQDVGSSEYRALVDDFVARINLGIFPLFFIHMLRLYVLVRVCSFRILYKQTYRTMIIQHFLY